jgi:hypothetical protein
MIRDTRKDAGYFKEYLEYQNKRIGEFYKKAETARDDSQSKKLYLYIGGFFRDKLYASYSSGADVIELNSVYKEWLAACEKASSVSYSDLIDLAGLCVLLESGEESVKRVLALMEHGNERDDLLEFFKNFLAGSEHKSGGDKIKYDAYAGLKAVLTSTDKVRQAELLRNYVSNIWYSANSDSAWHDAHLGKQDTYVGYWCFVGAAIAKMINLDVNLFRGVEFYPSDLS